jgi:hypothetical protein
VLGVQQWAEVRRLVLVEGRSQREVARLTGLARDTVAKAGRGRPCSTPPSPAHPSIDTQPPPSSPALPSRHCRSPAALPPG